MIRSIKFLPILMALGVGLCVSNAKAIMEALFGKTSEFVRTPKYGDGKVDPVDPVPSGPIKKRKADVLPYIELAFGVYMAICAVVSAVDIRSAITTPFLVIFTFGFFYVSLMSFHARRTLKKAEQRALPSPVKQKV